METNATARELGWYAYPSEEEIQGWNAEEFQGWLADHPEYQGKFDDYLTNGTVPNSDELYRRLTAQDSESPYVGNKQTPQGNMGYFGSSSNYTSYIQSAPQSAADTSFYSPQSAFDRVKTFQIGLYDQGIARIDSLLMRRDYGGSDLNAFLFSAFLQGYVREGYEAGYENIYRTLDYFGMGQGSNVDLEIVTGVCKLYKDILDRAMSDYSTRATIEKFAESKNMPARLTENNIALLNELNATAQDIIHSLAKRNPDLMPSLVRAEKSALFQNEVIGIFENVRETIVEQREKLLSQNDPDDIYEIIAIYQTPAARKIIFEQIGIPEELFVYARDNDEKPEGVSAGEWALAKHLVESERSTKMEQTALMALRIGLTFGLSVMVGYMGGSAMGVAVAGGVAGTAVDYAEVSGRVSEAEAIKWSDTEGLGLIPDEQVKSLETEQTYCLVAGATATAVGAGTSGLVVQGSALEKVAFEMMKGGAEGAVSGALDPRLVDPEWNRDNIERAGGNPDDYSPIAGIIQTAVISGVMGGAFAAAGHYGAQAKFYYDFSKQSQGVVRIGNNDIAVHIVSVDADSGTIVVEAADGSRATVSFVGGEVEVVHVSENFSATQETSSKRSNVRSSHPGQVVEDGAQQAERGAAAKTDHSDELPVVDYSVPVQNQPAALETALIKVANGERAFVGLGSGVDVLADLELSSGLASRHARITYGNDAYFLEAGEGNSVVRYRGKDGYWKEVIVGKGFVEKIELCDGDVIHLPGVKPFEFKSPIKNSSERKASLAQVDESGVSGINAVPRPLTDLQQSRLETLAIGDLVYVQGYGLNGTAGKAVIRDIDPVSGKITVARVDSSNTEIVSVEKVGKVEDVEAGLFDKENLAFKQVHDRQIYLEKNATLSRQDYLSLFNGDFSQDNVGNCYLISLFNSLVETPEEFEVLMRTSIRIEADGSWSVKIPLTDSTWNTGNTIKIIKEDFKPQTNPNYGKKHSYKNEIDYRKTLYPIEASRGFKILEAAYIKKVTKSDVVDRSRVEGGNTIEAVATLMGSSFDSYMTISSPEPLADYRLQTESYLLSFQKGWDVATVGSKLSNGVGHESVYTSGLQKIHYDHYYSIEDVVVTVDPLTGYKSVSKIIVVNPHDTYQKIEMTLEEFLYAFTELNSYKIDQGSFYQM